MSELQIVEVSTKAHMDEFIGLPKKIYAHATLWVPNLEKDERNLLTPSVHPFWQEATGQLFLAYRAGKAVGRIAAFSDDNYNSYANDHCGAWGFFECYDDEAAAHALFDAAAKWHQKQGLKFMRGPLSPSLNYMCGMLVDGFELAPYIMMPWNFDYYPRLVESWFMRKEQDLFAYTFERDKFNPAPWLHEQIGVIKSKNEFTFRISTKATLTEDIHTMLDIYQAAWAKNWGFTPMSLSEAKQHVHSLKSILDPNFFVLFYHKNNPAGGMLALPDMNPLLKRLNGKIGLSAPWHFLQSRQDLRSHYRLLLFGILDKYKLMGLPLLVLDFIFQAMQKNPHLKTMEGSWSLEDNAAINDLIEDFGGILTKRYRIYRRELDSICN